MGVGLGAGFDITKNVGINARYVAGFSDVTKPSLTLAQMRKTKTTLFKLV